MPYINEPLRDEWAPVKTIFPKVISASRATDIPAFYADWLMERLRAGHCEWKNPFNARQTQLVSFAEARAIVFWSKNPAPLLPYLKEIEDHGKSFYFQFTLNDYVPQKLEPGVPGLAERIRTFNQLARNYKVIWRYDPVLFGSGLDMESHMQAIKNLMLAIGDQTEKLVFSFVDLYGRVEKNLEKINPDLKAPALREMKEFASRLVELRDKIAPRLELATCAEAEMDFEKMGIEKNRCIDPVLINKICGEEIYRPVQKKSSIRQASLLGLPTGNSSAAAIFEKDKGQRQACQCAPSKDIGNYRSHPCKHRCLYCYAGHFRNNG